MDTPPGKASNSRIRLTPGGIAREEEDWQALRWGREKDEGFGLSRYFQSTPMLYTADGHNCWFGDMYRGRSAFLISSGPSTKAMDLTVLRQPGIVTFGINNSPKLFRPNLWACVDSPSNFMRSIWLDPTIMKFCPICHTNKQLLNNDSGPRSGFKNGKDAEDGFNSWEWMKTLVRDCPNTWYYRRNAHFRADQFLWEDTFNWGNSKDLGGSRSILLVALRLCYILGFQKVYLLGVDFHMSADQRYAFDQDRSKSSIAGNNSTYATLTERFTQLKPIFDKEGFDVYNCNPASALKVFPHISLTDAVEKTLIEFGVDGKIDLSAENTLGLYDREDKIKKAHEAKVDQEVEDRKIREAKEGMKRYTDDDRRDAKAKLDAARAYLQTVKDMRLALIAAEPKDPEELRKWDDELKKLTEKEERTRTVFREAEDRKRFMNGEPIRWGLWDPSRDQQPRKEPI